MKRIFSLVLVVASLFLLFSNLQRFHNQTYTPAGHFWNLESLRGLDEIDALQSPEIIAYYARITPDGLQLRIDFLDSQLVDPSLLFIEIFDDSVYQISLSSLSDKQNTYWFNNQQQNYITIQLPQSFKQFEFRFILKNHQHVITDFTSKFSLYSKIPPPIQISLRINNTQLGYTPAQILRNWDGAHNGPNGERFGLLHLLEASKNFRIPIILTDFYTPENINAVDAVRQEDFITRMVTSGFVTFCPPDFFQDDVFSSYINYFNGTLLSKNYPPVTLCKSDQGSNQIPSPIFNKYGLTTDGTKFLINSYFTDPEQEWYLTESFRDSFLGDYSDAPVIFDFLKNHPWLQFSSSNPVLESASTTQYPDNEMQTLAKDLYNAKGPFQKQALFHFYTLLNPQNYEYLQLLIPEYIPDFYYQIEANRWAGSPTTMVVCDRDIDKDQENECMISNQNFFLVYELTGGYIPFIAVKDKTNDFFQLIGSSSQMIFGLSPSQEWKTGNGVFSDPSVLPGMITKPVSDKQVRSISSDQTQLLLSDEDKPENSLRITLLDNQLTLNYSVSNDQQNIEIPFFCQHQGLPVSNLPPISPQEVAQTINLTCQNNPFVVLINGQQVEAKHYSIQDLNTHLQNPENPDFEYPRAHYIPLGISLTEINFASQLNLTFVIP